MEECELQAAEEEEVQAVKKGVFRTVKERRFSAAYSGKISVGFSPCEMPVLGVSAIFQTRRPRAVLWLQEIPVPSDRLATFRVVPGNSEERCETGSQPAL